MNKDRNGETDGTGQGEEGSVTGTEGKLWTCFEVKSRLDEHGAISIVPL